eukprot:2543268-Amphidinium_carterae.2
MARNRCRMRHRPPSMYKWAWERRPSSAHTLPSTGPGEAWALTSPNTPLRNTLPLGFGMPGIGFPSKRNCLTSNHLPGCPASHQAVNQPTLFDSGAENEPSVTSTYICGVDCTSRCQKLRLGVTDMACGRSQRLVNQPIGSFVCVQFVACVRTRANRTSAATLLKCPALSFRCPGAWTLQLDTYVHFLKEYYSEQP